MTCVKYLHNDTYCLLLYLLVIHTFLRLVQMFISHSVYFTTITIYFHVHLHICVRDITEPLNACLTYTYFPVSILYKSTAGRYRPVSYPDGPITARCRFIKNASWVYCASLGGSVGNASDWVIRAQVYNHSSS